MEVFSDETKYEICLTAVKQNGMALQFVPLELIDHAICLAAVKSDGRAYHFVPKQLAVDLDICREAIISAIRVFES